MHITLGDCDVASLHGKQVSEFVPQLPATVMPQPPVSALIVSAFAL